MVPLLAAKQLVPVMAWTGDLRECVVVAGIRRAAVHLLGSSGARPLLPWILDMIDVTFHKSSQVLFLRGGFAIKGCTWPARTQQNIVK